MKRPRHQNPNGTWNGVSFMAELSGLSQEEVRWTWERAKELRAAGVPKEEAAAQLKAEAKAKFGKKSP